MPFYVRAHDADRLYILAPKLDLDPKFVLKRIIDEWLGFTRRDNRDMMPRAKPK